MEGKARQWELKEPGHIMPVVRKQRATDAGIQLLFSLFLFHPVWDSRLWDSVTHVQGGGVFSPQLTLKHLHRHAQRHMSLGAD